MEKMFLKISFLALATSSMLLTACNPGKKDGANPDPAGFTKISSVDEKTASCEQVLRKKMKAREIQFQAASNFDEEIKFANAALPTLPETTYSLGKKSSVPSVMNLGFAQRGKIGYQSFKYSLELNDATSETLLQFSISFSRADGKNGSELLQAYQVGEDCALKLTSTKISSTIEKSKNQYRHLNVALYANGESSVEPKDFSIPDGSFLTELREEIQSPAVLRNGSLAYMDGVGLVVAKVTPKPDMQMSEFNQTLSLASVEVELLSGKQSVLTLTGASTRDGRFSFYDIANQIAWIVPGEIWESISLGTVRVSAQLFQKNFDDTYLYSHDSYVLATNKALSYDHRSAYWNITGNGVDAKTGLEGYVLQERSVPTIADGSTAADLASNDTIQTKLPEIQAIAKTIRDTKPTDRRQKITAVLQYLKNNYVYDYEMVKNNTVRPLTTQEALTRKKGVCQHYAVLFTAIARALEVPTRIVVGYALFSGQPGGHAWIEAQVEPGLWQVIEPQKADGLQVTNTRFYFPTDRADFLEDKNAGMGSYYSKMLGWTYIATPL